MKDVEPELEAKQRFAVLCDAAQAASLALREAVIGQLLICGYEISHCEYYEGEPHGSERWPVRLIGRDGAELARFWRAWDGPRLRSYAASSVIKLQPLAQA